MLLERVRIGSIGSDLRKEAMVPTSSAHVNTPTPIFPLLLTCCVALSACLSFPEASSPDDAAVDDAAVTDSSLDGAMECGLFDAGCLIGNTIVATGQGATLSNGNVQLRFSQTHGYLLTSLILHGDSTGANLIHNGTANERFVGVHNWSFGFQWRAVPSVQILASGEAVFRFRLDSTDGPLQVRSYYTIFPDGRIHRDEQASVTALVNGQNGAALSAYIGLNPAHFSQVESSYHNTASPISSPISTSPPFNHLHEQSGNNSGWACASHSDRMIGMAHSLGSSDQPAVSSHSRITESAPDPGIENQLVSLIYDWAKSGLNGAQVGDLYSGNFVIAGSASSDCSHISELWNWLFRFPATLVLENASFESGGNSDDNSDGYYEGGGFWAISSTNGSSLTFTVDTESGALNEPKRAAFRLHGLALSADITPDVAIDGVRQLRGRDFLWQSDIFGETPNEELVHWVYLGRELTDGQRVQISVPSEN